MRLPNFNMMLGDWGEPERMRRQIVSNDDGGRWLTGDTATMDADGYVDCLGPGDDVINSAGYRVGQVEVENVQLEHRAVREHAAVASPDAERGEVVKAFMVPADEHTGSDALARAPNVDLANNRDGSAVEKLDSMVQPAKLGDLLGHAEPILGGGVTGRVVVAVNAERNESDELERHAETIVRRGE